MSEPNEIRFTYGSASAKLNRDKNKLEYDGEDKNKLRAGLQNIFNAIKKLDTPDDKKIDSARETELLNKLSSIFQAGGSTNIDDDEMAWAKGFQAGGDVVEFINTKYNEVVGRQQDGQVNNDGVVEEVQEEAVEEEEAEEVLTPAEQFLSTLPKLSEAVEMPSASKPDEPFNNPVMLGKREVDEERTVVKNRFFGLFGKKELKYDKEGRLISKTIIRNNGTKKREVIYDEQENSVRKMKYNSDGNLKNVQEYIQDGNKYEYDDYGNISKVTEYSDNGKLKQSTWYTEDGKPETVITYDDNEKPKNLTRLDLATVEEHENNKIVKTTDYSAGEKPTIAEYDSEGKVKKLAKYTKDGYVVTKYNSDGSSIKTYYNENGTPVETEEYNKDNKLVKVSNHKENNIHEYDDGVLKRTTERDSDGNVVSVYEFEYNENGKLAKGTKRDSEGNVVNVCEYEYDDNGDITKVTIIDSEGNQQTYNKYDNLGNLIIEPSGTEFIIYEYDANGNKTKVTNYDTRSGEVTSIDEYDANGNRTKYTAYNSDGSIRYFDTWDEQGRKIRDDYSYENPPYYEIKEYEGDSTEPSKVTKYKPDGTLFEE